MGDITYGLAILALLDHALRGFYSGGTFHLLGNDLLDGKEKRNEKQTYDMYS